MWCLCLLSIVVQGWCCRCYCSSSCGACVSSSSHHYHCHSNCFENLQNWRPRMSLKLCSLVCVCSYIFVFMRGATSYTPATVHLCQTGAAFSTPALSTPATWCRMSMCPLLHSPFCIQHSRWWTSVVRWCLERHSDIQRSPPITALDSTDTCCSCVPVDVLLYVFFSQMYEPLGYMPCWLIC